MKKEQLLQQISQLSAKDGLSSEELLSAYKSGLKDKSDDDPAVSIRMVDTLYYMGGAVIFLGMFISLRQHFLEFSPLVQIIKSLGLGITAYFMGVLLVQDKNLLTVSQVFFFISALFMPYGLFILYARAGWSVVEYSTLILIFTMLFGVYLGAYLIFRKNILLLLSIIFGTLLIYVFTSMVAGIRPVALLYHLTFYQYLTLFIGIGYTIIGYLCSKDNNKYQLSGVLYALGAIGYLNSALVLGGWRGISLNLFWQLLFPCIAFISIALSVYLKRKVLLAISSFFLLWYIWKV